MDTLYSQMSKTIIKQVDFNNDFSEIEKIRSTVFINEQNVPVELEWDEFDNESTHILAYYDNKAVATARLLPDGHIGRMAILKDYRNKQIGKKMLKYLIELAFEKSIKKIELSAQEHAVEFYKKQGFSVCSEMYLDAGIPHYNMIYSKDK